MIKKLNIYLLCLAVLFTQFSVAEEKFVSLKKNKVNVRYGPSLESKIKYIYKKINLPIKQIDEKENFRRIVDLKNNSGWIHTSQLKPSNSIIILENKILFKKPSNLSKPVAKLEKGRLLVVKKCEGIWCSINTGNYFGWIKAENIWGSIK
jgi:SH3-like domain-containing protein|tara:strand:- start:270 stop:719 length:450 start_codon:yes stop_codon:yes gene_type:complete